MSEQKRKILGPLEWFALLAALGIIAYITFSKAGYKVVERSVDVEFIDPAKSNKLQPIPKKRSKTEDNVDRMLADMAANFKREANGAREKIGQQELQQKWGMSESEASFYDLIRTKAETDDRIQSVTDWFHFLNSSRKTYNEVKSLVETLAPNQNRSASPKEIIENEASAEDFYNQLKDWYNISFVDLESFAAKGKNSLEDWASFLVLQNSKQN